MHPGRVSDWHKVNHPIPIGSPTRYFCVRYQSLRVITFSSLGTITKYGPAEGAVKVFFPSDGLRSDSYHVGDGAGSGSGGCGTCGAVGGGEGGGSGGGGGGGGGVFVDSLLVG